MSGHLPTPIAVFCLDGWGDDYFSLALGLGHLPRLLRAMNLHTPARAAMPTFTNPNNLSIITGKTPADHGISGNTTLDRTTRQEVALSDPSMVRCPSILNQLQTNGRTVLSVTAKDKLRRLLGAGAPSETGRRFSMSVETLSERPMPGGLPDASELVGRAPPAIYSGDVSLYALELGLRASHRLGADVVYVSLTDYIQHKFPPAHETSLAFAEAVDARIGAFLDAGFVVGVTADHGMNDKTRDDGSPNVVYLEDALAPPLRAFCQVVLPITDPYVVHHGSLGGTAFVYLTDTAPAAEIKAALAALSGISEVLDAAEASSSMSLPADRIGDLIVLAEQSSVLGKHPAAHDLTAVRSGLRSHGSRFETEVPFVIAGARGPVEVEHQASPLRNADIFPAVLAAAAAL